MYIPLKVYENEKQYRIDTSAVKSLRRSSSKHIIQISYLHVKKLFIITYTILANNLHGNTGREKMTKVMMFFKLDARSFVEVYV